jgi:hypothetical protein
MLKLRPFVERLATALREVIIARTIRRISADDERCACRALSRSESRPISSFATIAGIYHVA